MCHILNSLSYELDMFFWPQTHPDHYHLNDFVPVLTLSGYRELYRDLLHFLDTMSYSMDDNFSLREYFFIP